LLLASLLTSFDERRSVTTSAHSEEPSLADTLKRLPADERPTALSRHVRTRVLKLVGLPADRTIDEQLGFREIGLDSLLAVELRNVLQADLNLSLSATMAFDYPTLSSLTRHLLSLIGLESAIGTPPADRFVLEDSSIGGTPINELSEVEAEALLEAELEALARHSSRAN
jgi:acyl carrier protein